MHRGIMCGKWFVTEVRILKRPIFKTPMDEELFKRVVFSQVVLVYK